MKKRLDQLLVDKGLFPTRTRAQAAIMAGLVFVENQRIDKAGTQIGQASEIEIKGKPHPYVGRGGVKLEGALKEFKIDVKGKISLDVGASTGGFTDCLLQNGVEKVYAVDVGHGQLDWKLRNDPRVKVFERLNARSLALKNLGLEKSDISLAVIDVSFISLLKILPAVYNLLTDEAIVVALIKPQFEAKREQVGKGGIVRDEKVRREVVEKTRQEAEAQGFEAKGIIQSPITGTDGNVEYFIYLKKEK
ncbi:MAG: TlyA family RNA methyltransferase [Candidatus Margulisiibacteriota bacterium]|nr:TlyA family RNA methyltransferase [Candidatus Margulisiibacteriota bacterium]